MSDEKDEWLRIEGEEGMVRIDLVLARDETKGALADSFARAPRFSPSGSVKSWKASYGCRGQSSVQRPVAEVDDD